jgi:hypothetical protein
VHDKPPSRLPGVSVVMATFNGEAHVLEQLESIANQTVKPLEILIGDDGSTDRTLDILRSFASGAEVPVSVTRNETRLGYGENFMTTASRARGTMIAFSDQDDVWFENRLDYAVRALERPDCRLWISGWCSVDQSLQPIPMRRLHTGFHQRSIVEYPLFVFHGSRMVLDATLIDYLPARGRPPSVFGGGAAHHDEWASFAAHALGEVCIGHETLMYYRRHRTAVSAGAPSVPSRRWLLSRLGEPTIARVTEAAQARAVYLRDRANVPECAGVREQLLEAAAYYEQIVPRLQRRCRTRRHPHAYGRVASLLRALAAGDYRALRAGGLGLWNLLQDVYSLKEPEPDRPAPTDANRI